MIKSFINWAMKKVGKQMAEKYLAIWKFRFVNKVCKLESHAMFLNLNCLKKYKIRKLRKLSNESVRFRGVRSATLHPLHFRDG